tara:strand:- start:761 stop:2269 length:1509 start_codon:yes stop_codon:yes gene_type:complete
MGSNTSTQNRLAIGLPIAFLLLISTSFFIYYIITQSQQKCTYKNTTCPNQVWDQCGGKDFDGNTCCQKDNTCVETNEYYSQCMPFSPTPIPSHHLPSRSHSSPTPIPSHHLPSRSHSSPTPSISQGPSGSLISLNMKDWITDFNEGGIASTILPTKSTSVKGGGYTVNNGNGTAIYSDDAGKGRILYNGMLQFKFNSIIAFNVDLSSIKSTNSATCYSTFPFGPNMKEGCQDYKACLSENCDTNGFGYLDAINGCQLGDNAKEGCAWSNGLEMDWFEINTSSGLCQTTFHGYGNMNGDRDGYFCRYELKDYNSTWNTKPFFMAFKILDNGLNIYISTSKDNLLKESNRVKKTYHGNQIASSINKSINFENRSNNTDRLLDWQKYIISKNGWVIYQSLNPDYIITGGVRSTGFTQTSSKCGDFIINNYYGQNITLSQENQQAQCDGTPSTPSSQPETCTGCCTDPKGDSVSCSECKTCFQCTPDYTWACDQEQCESGDNTYCG